MNDHPSKTHPPPPEVIEGIKYAYGVQVKHFRTMPEKMVMPAFLVFKKRNVAVIGLSMEDEREKDACATIMNLATEKLKPDFTIFVSESWVSRHTQDQLLDGKPLVMPRDDPHHLDALVMFVQWGNHQAQVVAPICHAPDGTRSIPAELPEVTTMKCEGRMVVETEKTK